MSKWCVIRKASTQDTVLARARWCTSYWCKMRGLQFRRRLPEGEGLLFDFKRESVAATSIHMFFVFFAIAAIWIDDEGIVVGAKLAKPWRPFYASDKPARYLIEALPEVLEQVQIGDKLDFDDLAT